MPENARGGGSPSDDPRDYDLPTTVSIDKPSADELPEEVSPSDIPDTETISAYTGDPETVRDTSALYQDLADHLDTEAEIRAVVVLFNHRLGDDMHPQEISARADVEPERLPDVLDALTETGLARQTRTVDGIPFYEFNGVSTVGLNLVQTHE